jgi:hypothetical protein
VVRSTKDNISGSIYMPGFEISTSASGATLIQKDPDGFFILYKTDPLAELDDGELASLSEWRSK